MPDARGPLDVQDAGTVRTVRVPAGPSATATLPALHEAVRTLAADPAVRCLVLDLSSGFGPGELPEEPGVLASVVAALASLSQPVVAVLGGLVRGPGLALACAADLRVLGASARLDPGFAADALAPEGGLSWTLPRLVGHGRAMDLLLRPRELEAGEAAAIGLATLVVEDEGLERAGQRLAAELAAGPPLAQAAVKRSLAHGAEESLVATMQMETQRAAMLRRTRDHAEATSARAEGRVPRYEGR